jgi:hypothetical protein
MSHQINPTPASQFKHAATIAVITQPQGRNWKLSSACGQTGLHNIGGALVTGSFVMARSASLHGGQTTLPERLAPLVNPSGQNWAQFVTMLAAAQIESGGIASKAGNIVGTFSYAPVPTQTILAVLLSFNAPYPTLLSIKTASIFQASSLLKMCFVAVTDATAITKINCASRICCLKAARKCMDTRSGPGSGLPRL